MSLLSFDICTVNGDRLEYTCDDEAQAARILSQLNSPRVFSAKTIILASEFNVANMPGDSVEMISLRSISPENFGLDVMDGQLMEVSEEEFKVEYIDVSPEEKLAARHADPGETILIFLKLNFISGSHIYLKLQVPKKTGPEGKIFFTHLFDHPSIMFSLKGGGKGIANPRKLASIINYPGPGDDVLPETTLHASSKTL